MEPEDEPPFTPTTETPAIANTEQAAVITPTTADTPQDTSLPLTDEAITSIEAYQFDPGLGTRTDASTARQQQQTQKEEEEVIATALLMFTPATPTAHALPNLRTENWPYAGEKLPNPISIGTAYKLLAAGYAEIPCELEAAGDQGYAWIIEDDTTWLARGGIVKVIPPPGKPKEITGFDLKAHFENAIKSKCYSTYKHLCQEGKAKILEWFGKDVFLDLLKDGVLPPSVTPNEMLEHIENVYATPQNNRVYMEQVEERLNGSYDPKEPVEAYFLRVQEARVMK